MTASKTRQSFLRPPFLIYHTDEFISRTYVYFLTNCAPAAAGRSEMFHVSMARVANCASLASPHALQWVIYLFAPLDTTLTVT